jgi:hypothetical protein
MPIPAVSRLKPQCPVEKHLRPFIVSFFHGALGVAIEDMGGTPLGFYGRCRELLLSGSRTGNPFSLIGSRFSWIIDTMRSASVENKRGKNQQKTELQELADRGVHEKSHKF